MEDHLSEFQAAVYAALTADTLLMGMINKVFDEVQLPGGADPYGDQGGYVSLGPEYGSPEDDAPEGFGGLTQDVITIQIDSWSRQPGRPHLKQIVGRIRAVMDDAVFDLPTHAHSNTTLELFRITPDPSDGVRHAVLQYEVTLERR